MVDVKPLRIEKGIVRGLHLQYRVDLFLRPACGGVSIVQADNKTVNAVETAKIRVRESRDVSAPAFSQRRNYGIEDFLSGGSL